jgi:hypothetical protein
MPHRDINHGKSTWTFRVVKMSPVSRAGGGMIGVRPVLHMVVVAVVVLSASVMACTRPSEAHDAMPVDKQIPVAPAAAMASFVGDFETGNFDQWPYCQNVVVTSAPCSELHNSTYSMTVENDVVRQGKFAARFEVRQGDRPLCCGDRAEVSGDDRTAAGEGDDRWYQWSTMFDASFPAGLGYNVVAQWHGDADGSPPVAISAGPTDVGVERWGIVIHTYDAPGKSRKAFTPWSAPVVRNVWNDIKMHIKWSARDDVGFVEFWLNGAPQTFTADPCAGQTRCMVRTLMPDGGGIYFKQGLYRDYAVTAPGIVYHDGFSQADTEADLAPL